MLTAYAVAIPWLDNKCQRTMNVTLQEEWNPSGYYTVTVNFNLQFDPVLLKHLRRISINSCVSSQCTLARKSTEYVFPKPLVSA